MLTSVSGQSECVNFGTVADSILMILNSGTDYSTS